MQACSRVQVMHTRNPAVAGMFYPGDARRLTATVDAFLADARSPQRGAAKAIIAPHAGYRYSGPIAGSAYHALLPRAESVGRVVLIGPSHHVSFPGVAVSRAAGFASPLGVLPVDRDTVEELLKDNLVQENDLAHAEEHSLEVHLPFLQRIFPRAALVPLLTGDGDFRSVAAVLDRVWGDRETVVVVSSDLSHYLDYRSACRIDRETADAITARSAGAVGFHQACGATPINALLQIAGARNLSMATLDLRNSGDTAGSRDQVVGYGAFACGFQSVSDKA